jgi:serine/threonine protein kinase
MKQYQHLINSNLGRYKILERVGSGGMATVFKAEDSNLGRMVAIKVLHGYLADESGFKERFEQEAKFIAGFNHPNIVQVYDFDGIEKDNERIYYMVMPFISGKTLDTVIKEYREKESILPVERIRQIMLDLCAALNYAHERGMIHRDIKPSNVLLDENGRAILTDFGIARLVMRGGLTQEGTIVGTPAYMSPEQATGDRLDNRTDLYSLGVILFELLTGRIPFDDDGTVSVLLKHVQTPPPNVSDFIKTTNPYYDTLASRALAKDPDNRYQTANEFAEDIKAVFKGEKPTSSMPAVSNNQIPSSTIVLPKPSNFPDKPKRQTNTIIQTINAAVIQPARQNPMGFIAMAVALVTLLLVARLSQNQPTDAVAIASEPSTDSMVGEIPFGSSTFEPDDPMNAFWEITEEGLMQREITPDGVYLLTNMTEDTATVTLFEPTYKYSNVQILMNATLQDASAESSGYGIVFRYQDNDNYNVFAVDGLGRYSIWTREAGVWRELRNVGENWTPQEMIRPRGGRNVLIINVDRTTLTGYVNGTKLFTLEEATFEDGAIGIYTATPMEGMAQVAVDRYAISRADSSRSMTDNVSSGSSMTGDSSEEATPESTPETTAEATPSS